jgi:hypothetical protein
VSTAQHSIVSQPRRIAGFRRMFRPFSFNCFNSGSIAFIPGSIALFLVNYKPLATLPTQAVATQFASLQLKSSLPSFQLIPLLCIAFVLASLLPTRLHLFCAQKRYR